MPATVAVHERRGEGNGSNMSERTADIVRSHDLPRGRSCPEVGMAWLVVIILVVAVPVGLLVWARRTSDPPEGGDWGAAGGV
jgi:hypothetical protein